MYFRRRLKRPEMKKILSIAMILVAMTALANGAERALVLQVVKPSTGYSDLGLMDKIGFILSGVNGYDVVRAENMENFPGYDASPDFYGSDYQLPPSIACKYKAQYLVRVNILKADSYISSSTVLPFVFKAHKRKYKLETELRIIDSRTGQIIKKKKFEETWNGSRSLSYLELDATNEPALYSGYPKEMRIFSELEDKAARKIAEEVIKTTADK
jgi:hypothetical protein